MPKKMWDNKQGVVTMRSLGSNGRFANQLFQYAFLRFYAKKFNLSYQVPQWIGQELFGHRDDPVTFQFPQLFDPRIAQGRDTFVLEADAPITDVDFWGYFQYPQYYAQDKDFFRSLFAPVPDLRNALEKSWASLSGKDVIGLHLRYGDYGYGHFFETPIRWVRKELERRWEQFKNPVLYIASDDPYIHKLFKKYSPVKLHDIFDIQKEYPIFFYDFWALSHVNRLLMIANSSFSFAAAMMNDKKNIIMMRPHLKLKKFIKFDPWNSSTVLLYDTTKLLDFLAKHAYIYRKWKMIRRIFRNLLVSLLS